MQTLIAIRAGLPGKIQGTAFGMHRFPDGLRGANCEPFSTRVVLTGGKCGFNQKGPRAERAVSLPGRLLRPQSQLGHGVRLKWPSPGQGARLPSRLVAYDADDSPSGSGKDPEEQPQPAGLPQTRQCQASATRILCSAQRLLCKGLDQLPGQGSRPPLGDTAPLGQCANKLEKVVVCLSLPFNSSHTCLKAMFIRKDISGS